jgi:hypothetical protein
MTIGFTQKVSRNNQKMLTIIRPPVKYKALTMGDGDMEYMLYDINSALTNAVIEEEECK